MKIDYKWYQQTRQKRLMALSETVRASLRDAQENLKNALACAARTEKPFVSKTLLICWQDRQLSLMQVI